MDRETSEQVSRRSHRPNNLFQARGQDHKRLKCVYCGNKAQRSSACKRISTVDQREQFLAKLRVIAPDKRTADCFRQTTCQKYHNYHHLSICDCEKPDSERQALMTANGNDKGMHDFHNGRQLGKNGNYNIRARPVWLQQNKHGRVSNVASRRK